MNKIFSALLLAIISLTSITTLSAQTASINGRILEGKISSGVQGVNVYLKDQQKGTYSNSKGYFQLSNIQAGNYTLVASAVGYESVEEKISLEAGENLRLDLQIKETVLEMPGIVVERVTMTGGKTGLPDIPGSATYISPRELEKFSYFDINRTLRMVPGVNIQEEDGFGLRPNIGMRGTGVERSSKITIMEDGILMAPAPYSAPAAYYFPTVGRMQGIEVVKGSSQVKFGPYTTGGAINFISSQIPSSFQGRLHLMGGNFGNRLLHANVGHSFQNYGFLVETFQTSADGFKQLADGSDTGFDKQDYLIKFKINTNSTARFYQALTIKAAQTTETSNETYLGLTEQDFEADPYQRYAASQRDQMNTQQQQYMVRHNIIFNKHLDLTTSLYRNEFSRNWYKLDKVKPGAESSSVSISDILSDPGQNQAAYDIVRGASSSNPDALSLKNNNRNYYSQGLESILGIQFEGRNISHEMELGLRVHYDQVDRFQWVDLYQMDQGVLELTEKGEPGTESNRVEEANAVAAFLQYQLKWGNFTAIPGLRYESMQLSREDYGKNDPQRTGSELSNRENQVDVWIPGIGFDYKFSQNISAFAGIHKGFSPPGSKEGTNPESSVNYELGLRMNEQFLAGQAVLFYNDYSNLLGADLAAAGGTGSANNFNGGEVNVRGLELQMTYNLVKNNLSPLNIPLTVSYTYTDAVFQNTFESDFEAWGNVEKGDHLPYLANHQLGLLLGLEYNNLMLNASGKFVSEMLTKAGQGEIPDSQKTDAQYVVDLSGNYLLTKNLTLFANVNNLFNQVYVVAMRPAGLRPGMPRAFTLGIKAGF